MGYSALDPHTIGKEGTTGSAEGSGTGAPPGVNVRYDFVAAITRIKLQVCKSLLRDWNSGSSVFN